MELNNQNGILSGLEMMGDNIRNKLQFCGKSVYFYPLCKMIRAENAKVDDFTRILDYSYIDAGESLIIGKHSMIAWQTIIEGGGKTRIGDRVFVGPGTKILTSTYEFEGLYAAEFIPEECRAFRYGNIVIGDDAYIGSNCVVMPGTHIGEGAVVGANSLVTKDLKPWTIYVGSPCKELKKRSKPSDDIRKKLFNKVDWSNNL